MSTALLARLANILRVTRHAARAMRSDARRIIPPAGQKKTPPGSSRRRRFEANTRHNVYGLSEDGGEYLEPAMIALVWLYEQGAGHVSGPVQSAGATLWIRMLGRQAAASMA
jgi:hypothetical protein